MSADIEAVFHIAIPDQWTEARQSGEYRVSTRDKTLDDVGFIHGSRGHQLAKVANLFYSDLTELLVVEIDPDLLGADIRDEAPTPESTERYPHIYGPIPTGAVLAEEWWERGADGVWHRPPFI